MCRHLSTCLISIGDGIYPQQLFTCYLPRLGLTIANTPYFPKKAWKGRASDPKQVASVHRSSPWGRAWVLFLCSLKISHYFDHFICVSWESPYFSSASTASNPNACFFNTLAGSILSFNGGFSMSLWVHGLSFYLWKP